MNVDDEERRVGKRGFFNRTARDLDKAVDTLLENIRKDLGERFNHTKTNTNIRLASGLGWFDKMHGMTTEPRKKTKLTSKGSGPDCQFSLIQELHSERRES